MLASLVGMSQAERMTHFVEQHSPNICNRVTTRAEVQSATIGIKSLSQIK